MHSRSRIRLNPRVSISCAVSPRPSGAQVAVAEQHCAYLVVVLITFPLVTLWSVRCRPLIAAVAVRSL